MYSYIGSWGIRAAAFGASNVTCCDSSPLALERARENAQRSGVTIDTLEGDALKMLDELAAQKRAFDVVVVDPPALIKRRKDAPAGQRLYEKLNRAALNVLAPGGLLVSCSCSHHLEPAMLQRAILGAAKDANRRAQILEKHAHAPDHPIHPAMPETEYLKAFRSRLTLKPQRFRPLHCKPRPFVRGTQTNYALYGWDGRRECFVVKNADGDRFARCRCFG